MKKKRPPPTYESVALGALVTEFHFSRKMDAEETIRQRLRRKKLGAFDPDRISLLRRLKDDLQEEIGKAEKSSYYLGPADGRMRFLKYVEVNDFDVPRLTADMIARYPGVPRREIEWFVPHSVFIYHVL